MADVVCSQHFTNEVTRDEKPISWKDGLRIVDLSTLATQMHCKTCASMLDLNNTQSETRWGLASVLSVLCSFCCTLNDIYTGKAVETTDGKTVFEVNMKASESMALWGSGAQHIIHFLAFLDIPPLTDDYPNSSSAPHYPHTTPSPHHSPEDGCISSPSLAAVARETTLQTTMQQNCVERQRRVKDGVKKERCEELAADAACAVVCDPGGDGGSEDRKREVGAGKRTRTEKCDDDSDGGGGNDDDNDDDDAVFWAVAGEGQTFSTTTWSDHTPSNLESSAVVNKASSGAEDAPSSVSVPPLVIAQTQKSKAMRKATSASTSRKCKNLAINRAKSSLGKLMISGAAASQRKAAARQEMTASSKHSTPAASHENGKDSDLRQCVNDASDKLDSIGCKGHDVLHKGDDCKADHASHKEDTSPLSRGDNSFKGENAASKGGDACVKGSDSGLKREEFTSQQGTQPKRYRCPLCNKVLPSSRGFHIHVGRKHQASNLQASHHEVTGVDITISTDTGQGSHHGNISAATSGLSAVSSSSPGDGEKDVADTRSCHRSSSPGKEEGDGDTADDVTACSNSDTDSVKSKGTEPSCNKVISSTRSAGRSRIPCGTGACGKTFSTDTQRKRHLLKTHGESSLFSCTQCGKQYRSQKSLNIHSTVAHSTEDERKAVCKYCGEMVQHRRALKRHIKAHHPRGSKQTFYCDECPATFPQPCALKTHKLRHAGVKNYQCFYCDKRFSGSGNRLNHMRYFHERERKFLCDTCGAGFYRAYSLREHERVHSGEKPYQCERCAERFTKKEYLNIHMRTHTGERPYKCELCDKAFSQRSSRSTHRHKVHGVKKQETPGTHAQKQVVIDNKLVFVNA